MRKLPLSVLIVLSGVYNVCAQSTAFDKNKVMEFFLNMQYDDAINYLLPAERSDSSNLQILGFLGYAYNMNEDLASASRYYGKMLSIDSNNIAANQYFANFYSSSEPDQARGFVYRLIRLKPDNAFYYKKMGDLFRRKLQKDSALIYYDFAYQLSPNNATYGAGLAELLIDQKNYSRADSILQQGLNKDSLSILYLKLRIRLFYETKAYLMVLKPGETLIRLEEGPSSAFTQVALSYYNLKMYKDCIRVCDFMIDKELGSESVYYYAAKAWSKLNEYKISNELLRVCLKMAISNTADYYYHALGENYEELKQYKTAIAHYDTAYYLFKKPIMLYNSGRIWDSNLNNEPAAKRYYSRYLTVAKPESTDEKKVYDYVRKKWGKGKPKSGEIPDTALVHPAPGKF